jgi:PTS system glucitol/sorbitol-specific IIC component
MDLIGLVQGFVKIFQLGGQWFWALVSGMLPYIIVLMTAVNALVVLIGQERVDKFGAWAAKPGLLFLPIRYMLLPFVAVFVFTNPMAYTMGRFLPEKLKPAFYDAAVSYVHPPLGIFPHINAGELFVWLGIAAGVQKGYGEVAMADLAIRYLLVGLVVILIRGIVTERITAMLWKKEVAEEAA